MLQVPTVLAINKEHAKKLGIDSVADLVQYAKDNPGQLDYGSGGNGSGGHLPGDRRCRYRQSHNRADPDCLWRIAPGLRLNRYQVSLHALCLWQGLWVPATSWLRMISMCQRSRCIS